MQLHKQTSNVGPIFMFKCVISYLQLFISDTAMMMMMMMIKVVFAMQPDMVRVHNFFLMQDCYGYYL